MATRAANERSVKNRVVNGTLGVVALVALSVGSGWLWERYDGDRKADSQRAYCEVERRTAKTAVAAIRAAEPTVTPSEEYAIEHGYLKFELSNYDIVLGLDGSVSVVAAPDGDCE